MEIHESAFIADGAIVFGDVYVGEESSIWFHATVRGDRGEIRIGIFGFLLHTLLH